MWIRLQTTLGAVPETGGGCRHLSWWHRHHVLQKSFSFVCSIRCLLPPLLFPTLGEELDPHTNLSDARIKEGSGEHFTTACEARSWSTTPAGMPWVLQVGVEGSLVPHRLRSPQKSIRTDGCILLNSSFSATTGNARSSSRKRSRQFLSWSWTKAGKISRMPDTEEVTIGPQSWLSG